MTKKMPDETTLSITITPRKTEKAEARVDRESELQKFMCSCYNYLYFSRRTEKRESEPKRCGVHSGVVL